jgi:DNA polymerase elongation subunit (family B)
LLFLENGGKIEKIFYGIEFESFDNIFEEFISFFESIKAQGKIEKIFGKLMINSLYGRLGMDEIDHYSFFIEKNKINKISDINILSISEINDFFLIKAEIDNKLKKIFKIPSNARIQANVGIAASITSKARIKLYNAQKAVIENDGRLLYSDTDSIFAAYKKNVLNEKHGEIF